MGSTRPARQYRAVIAQCLFAVAGISILWVSPPAQGQMQLVPLAGQSTGELANYALAEGFTVIAAGGLPGSLVVQGERSRLGWSLFGHGILVLASSNRACAPV